LAPSVAMQIIATPGVSAAQPWALINATRQARLKAGARDERALEAVACTLHTLTGSPHCRTGHKAKVIYA
jgi:hypothetical protein